MERVRPPDLKLIDVRPAPPSAAKLRRAIDGAVDAIRFASSPISCASSTTPETGGTDDARDRAR